MASVSSLRGHDVRFSAEEQQELPASAEELLGKLNRLVDNLLDMSRLQAGALPLDPQPTGLEDVLSAAVQSLVGLGLALSRGLAEAMGGTLSPEDTPGGGLTMVLTIPSDPDSAPFRPTPRSVEEISGVPRPTPDGDLFS